jgi:AcrR family transcriptional regulator
MHDTIIVSATDLLKTAGLEGWTIDAVAQSAGCAKGLVNYHFGSKDTLLSLVRDRLEFERREARLEALAAASGTAALDLLWDALTREVHSGSFGAWIDLVRHFGPATRAGRGADEERTTSAAARALGLAEAGVVVQAPLLGPALEGLQLRLLLGEPAINVREGFDLLWLGVLA